jgi:hypothetical protein
MWFYGQNCNLCYILDLISCHSALLHGKVQSFFYLDYKQIQRIFFLKISLKNTLIKGFWFRPLFYLSVPPYFRYFMPFRNTGRSKIRSKLVNCAGSDAHERLSRPEHI